MGPAFPPKQLRGRMAFARAGSAVTHVCARVWGAGLCAGSAPLAPVWKPRSPRHAPFTKAVPSKKAAFSSGKMVSGDHREPGSSLLGAELRAFALLSSKGVSLLPTIPCLACPRGSQAAWEPESLGKMFNMELARLYLTLMTELGSPARGPAFTGTLRGFVHSQQGAITGLASNAPVTGSLQFAGGT